MDEDIKRTTVCQCTKCNEVFDFSNKGEGYIGIWGCPKCGGSIHIIQFENLSDEIYLNRLAITFND